MLLYLRDLLTSPPYNLDIPGYAVTGYLTFRAAMALLLSFIMTLMLGPWVIRTMARLDVRQQIRDDQGEGEISLLEMHKDKQFVPTAGGVMILVAMLLPVFIFGDLLNPFVGLLLAVTIGFAFLGFLDDYLKISRKNSKGLAPRYKLLGQGLLGLLVASFFYTNPALVEYRFVHSDVETVTVGTTYLAVPFLKSFYLDLGIFYIPFVIIFLSGFSNAVNLTDGLDGLAIGISIIVAIAFSVVTYLVSRPDFSQFLIIPHVPGAGETVILLTALIGAGMGFLWFNAHPAQIFMGDTGSLMLGGVFGTVAVLTKNELLLLIIGGIFVIETASVILQVGSYKLRGKRIFLMAPIHHHFEKLGWQEPKIIARFYILASLFALFGLSTLKMR